jgi:hypothetical protein
MNFLIYSLYYIGAMLAEHLNSQSGTITLSILAAMAISEVGVFRRVK